MAFDWRFAWSGQEINLKSMDDLFHNVLQDVLLRREATPENAAEARKKARAPGSRRHLSIIRAGRKTMCSGLSRLFDMIGKRPRARKCDVVLGIVDEGDELMNDAGEDSVCDAGIIATAQVAEHYEIASHGTLCAWAEALGKPDAATG